MFGLNFEKKLKNLRLSEVKEHTTRTAKRVYNLEIFTLQAQQEIEALREELERLRNDHSFTDKEFDTIRMKVILLDKAAGGTWRTASGHTLRIRDMSTDHIKRCLAGDFVGPLVRANMERELMRRKEEEFWRKQPMPPEDKAMIEPEDEEEFVGRIDGTPVYVDANVGMIQMGRVKAFIQRAREMRIL